MRMGDYQYTKDWFGLAPQIWPQLIPHLPGRKNFLEIGSFEGRSAVWIAQNMMEDGGELICIDTWEGGEEHVNGEMVGSEERFKNNTDLVMGNFVDRKIIPIKSTSVEALGNLIAQNKQFDFIYIDGSHVAKDVLTDACMSWPLLKQNGFMAFDDYLWKPEGFTINKRPKVAIDTFVNIFEDEISISFSGYQFIIRKIK